MIGASVSSLHIYRLSDMALLAYIRNIVHVHVSGRSRIYERGGGQSTPLGGSEGMLPWEIFEF